MELTNEQFWAIDEAVKKDEAWENRKEAVQGIVGGMQLGEDKPANSSMISKVREFHDTFGVSCASSPTIPDYSAIKLRLSLIEEEFEELKKAFAGRDIVEIADALVDLHYVISGTSLACGLPEDALFAEVHRSNMSKANEDGSVNRREDGKILKSACWSPPDIAQVLQDSKLAAQQEAEKPCIYCGPVCYGGAEHNARVKDKAYFLARTESQ